MSNMFGRCSGLTSLDLSSLDTGKVWEMNWMFYGCTSLMSLDLSSFNTGNVRDMSYMFFKCSSLTSLNLSNFDTGKVTSMRYMFNECYGLTSLNLSNFYTGNVTDMTHMFYNCSNLTILDLSSFITGNVKDMTHMFQYCSKLTKIIAGDGWSTEGIESGYSMFSSCTNLVGGMGTAYDDARIDGGEEAPGYFTSKTSTEVEAVSTTSGAHDAPTFTLSGQRLTAPKKGINIVGGRKVVVR